MKKLFRGVLSVYIFSRVQVPRREGITTSLRQGCLLQRTPKTKQRSKAIR